MRRFYVLASVFALACGGSNPKAESAGGAGNTGSSGSSSTAGAGSGSGGDAPSEGGSNAATVVLIITPGSTTVIQGMTTQLAAAVRGGPTNSLTWSMVESGTCGSVDANGLYTAPADLPQPAVCHVKASTKDPELSAVATMAIVHTPPTGKVDVWENVTPSEVNLDPNFHGAQQNFGTLGVIADPVRPNELYAFICYQGVWKSTDYGLTFKKISTGMNGANLDGGRPWTAVIDNNTARDASTPPTMYTANGYGPALGVYKSTDGGVNWTIYAAGMDVYSFDMDPYDNKHLITGMHESDGLRESTDGGVNWKTIATQGGGKSIFPYFMDTGDPATTRKTWLLVPQIDSGDSMYTTDAGATFKPTGGFSHPHGGNQLLRESPKVAYAAGSGGVWKTTDSGVSWIKMYSATDPYGYANGVAATKSSLYSWDTGSNLSGIGGSHVHKAARNPGTTWTPVDTPKDMNNGPHGLAVTYDGAHYILVGGAVGAGIWRYVEP